MSSGGGGAAETDSPPVAGPSRAPAYSRLFMGNLPKIKTETEIADELRTLTSGLVRVITYKNSENPAMHRGFCFLDYESLAAASRAKTRLTDRTVFGCRTIVDWADPEPEVDAERMASVRILFVRQYGGVLDEPTLAGVFGRYGAVERVKNLKSYSFVHFERRQDAQAAVDGLDGATDIDSGVRLEVSWAKPPADKQARERTLRDRERRMRLGCKTVPDWHAAAAASTTASAAATTPYLWYDHYRYDFGRSTPIAGCACRRFDCARPRKCCSHCPRAASTAGDHLHGQGCTGRDRTDSRECDGWTQRCAYGDDRRDCGDCVEPADDTMVDDNVLKFFYNVAVNAGSPPPPQPSPSPPNE